MFFAVQRIQSLLSILRTYNEQSESHRLTAAGSDEKKTLHFFWRSSHYFKLANTDKICSRQFPSLNEACVVIIFIVIIIKNCFNPIFLARMCCKIFWHTEFSLCGIWPLSFSCHVTLFQRSCRKRKYLQLFMRITIQ